MFLPLLLPSIYTNEFQLLNPESEAIHHFNVCGHCGGVYINYCYYVEYTHCTNYFISIIAIMEIMCWEKNSAYNSIGKL
jgi:hypothetical protein